MSEQQHGRTHRSVWFSAAVLIVAVVVAVFVPAIIAIEIIQTGLFKTVEMGFVVGWAVGGLGPLLLHYAFRIDYIREHVVRYENWDKTRSYPLHGGTDD